MPNSKRPVEPLISELPAAILHQGHIYRKDVYPLQDTTIRHWLDAAFNEHTSLRFCLNCGLTDWVRINDGAPVCVFCRLGGVNSPVQTPEEYVAERGGEKDA